MIIGIDPGITGAISFFSNHGRLLRVDDLPIMALGKKQQLNPSELTNIIGGAIEDPEFAEAGLSLNMGDYANAAYLEKVGAMPGQGVSSMFNFGMGYGAIQGVLAGLCVPLHLVTPQKWKKHHGLIGKDKDCARTLAQQLYPEASLARKKDIGRADAILIGDYGLRQKRLGA